MKRMRAAAAIHLQDKFSWFYLPWIVLSISFIINLIISHLLVEEPMVTGGLSSIHIFMLVAGVITMVQAFPFALGFNMRRTDFLLGTYATFVVISIWSGVLIWLLGLIEQSTNGWGSDLAFFHLPFVSDGSVLEQIAFQASVMLFCFMLGFLPASIHRRVGTSGLLIIAVAFSLVLTIAGYILSYLNVWPDIWAVLVQFRSIDVALILFAAAVIQALIGWLLIRRAVVK